MGENSRHEDEIWTGNGAGNCSRGVISEVSYGISRWWDHENEGFAHWVTSNMDRVLMG